MLFFCYHHFYKDADSMLIVVTEKENVKSLVEKITAIRGKNIPFFRPKRALLTTEASLVYSKTLPLKPLCIV
jgi:hypothetical protein